MASQSLPHQVLLAFLVAAFALAPSATLAKVFTVGGRKGWTVNLDYQSWAQGKDFRVGDKLVFKYAKKVHNVYKANGTEFQTCTVPAGADSRMLLTSGNDVVKLATPGRKWYICGVADHCSARKQKLLIVVKQAADSPAASPSPSSASASASASAAAAKKQTRPFFLFNW